MRISNPRDFGRVAVAMGGDSNERDVSLDGGAAVLEALLAKDVNAFAVDGVASLLEQVQEGDVDRVFNLLHGRGGEDGVLQGALQAQAIPVTGSSVLGSALSMDKARSKAIWLQAGLPTASYRVARRGDDVAAQADQLGYPVFVKPVSEGSSVGIGRVDEPSQLAEACEKAFAYEGQILLEQFIDGEELTVSVLQGRALPVVRIEPANVFYDYEAKYTDAGTQYHCPSGLAEALESQTQEIALAAFSAVACRGWGRVDFLRERSSGETYLLEANTTPGMTSHSLVPMAAKAIGLNFADLVWKILETSFAEGDV